MRKLLISAVGALIIGIVAITVSAQEKAVEEGSSSLDIADNDPITIDSPVPMDKENTASEYSGKFMQTNMDGNSWDAQEEENNSEDLIETLVDHGKNCKGQAGESGRP